MTFTQNAQNSQNSQNYSIAEIEQETGIKRDTLRVWERRYNFPIPLRNERRERIYSSEQLSRLRLIKQLMDSGTQPGKLVTLDKAQLHALAEQHVGRSVSFPGSGVLELLTGGSLCELQPRLEILLKELGLHGFLSNVVAPLNHAVGEAWFAGKLGILDEHHYTEQIRMILTAEMRRTARNDGARPRVLLSTMPGEPHGIGLLMVACTLSLEGAEVLSLGVQTPLEEIVRGAVENKCAIVGVSCSEYLRRRTVASQLVRLRSMLPENIALWAGGSGLRNITLLQENIRIFSDLSQISAALQDQQIRSLTGSKRINSSKKKEQQP